METAFVCKVEEIEEGKLKAVDVEGVSLMVTKQGNRFLVASRICTHKTFDLTQGIYSDGYVTCTLHTSTFDLSDGDAMNPPATEPLTVYEAIVKNDELHIIID